jgi:16S rRNA (guanine527-N7)-methyltransferase
LLEALAAEPDPHTTVVHPAEAVDVHVADSLSGLAVPELRLAKTVADIGAGAGFPGLVLAIALPGTQVDLIESAGRKAALIGRLAAAIPTTPSPLARSRRSQSSSSTPPRCCATADC